MVVDETLSFRLPPVKVTSLGTACASQSAGLVARENNKYLKTAYLEEVAGVFYRGEIIIFETSAKSSSGKDSSHDNISARRRKTPSSMK
jgi:hypothetical protein